LFVHNFVDNGKNTNNNKKMKYSHEDFIVSVVFCNQIYIIMYISFEITYFH